MKSYREVLAEKERERTLPAANSVHRSSLLFPVSPLPGARPVIVLSNHFKIKRDIAPVGMRVWGIDRAGQRAFSDHVVLDEARVYRYDVAAKFPAFGQLSTCQVEFFAGQNLGMPYPAVMVNYEGPGFHNMVHSFGRVLNDVFEAEEINSVRVSEASIDVCVDDERDTFLCFLTGAHALASGQLELTVRLPGGETLRAAAPVETTRYASTTVRLSEVFPGQRIPYGSVIRVATPEQPEFFGRMIGGITTRADGAFSANHTYYDHGVVAEYVDDAHGYNYYPLFPGRAVGGIASALRGDAMSFRLVFYPIQAPSTLGLRVEYFDESGTSLGLSQTQTLDSPDGDAAIVDVSGQMPAGARCFRIEARALGASRLPSRISHQVVIGGKGLAGSINESLVFPREQVASAPGGKPWLSWIQGVHGPGKRTQVGLSLVRDVEAPTRVDLRVYTEQGLLEERPIQLPPRGATVLDSRSLLGDSPDGDRYFFVYATCASSRIKMFSVVESLQTGHCSAEHNF